MLPSFIVWDINPTIIDSFITIRWYGLMFAIGFWIGFNLVARMFRREGVPENWVSILLVYVGIATIVGARLGHVFFYQWDYYSQHPWKILATWEGGLASHGGAIGIIIAVILYSIFTTKRNPLWTFDRLTIVIALVGGLIRLGNLMNSEIFGHATDLPWGFMFVRSAEWHQLYPGQAVHPTQIYEALTYFALFGLMWWMYLRRTPGTAVRNIPYRHIRLALFRRIHQKSAGSVRTRHASQHGAATEYSVRFAWRIPYYICHAPATHGHQLS